MKRVVWIIALAATSAFGQIQVGRVADDAKVVDRVAEAAKRDLPVDLLKRIVNDDIDLLRGKRTDGTYQYAGFERLESGRVENSFSVQPARSADDLAKVEMKGEFAYRLIVASPSRRMLVTKNRHVWIDRIDAEYIPIGEKTTKLHTVRVEAWLEPGDAKPFDFPEIARQVTARVYARADKDAGYGNIDLTLVQAKVFDDPTSPHADAVSSAKAILRALDARDIPSIRAMSARVYQDLQPAVAVAAVPATAPAPTPAGTPATRTVEVTAPKADDELYRELQSIEDLLTGTDAERRQGLDQLHQVLRKLRPR